MYICSSLNFWFLFIIVEIVPKEKKNQLAYVEIIVYTSQLIQALVTDQERKM